ncbi:MAG: 1-acyl-sn-glycerol-3-phosphate acyltransferase [Rickettsiales bacterium]|nr:1-acyl-sn-glycerol-3-phosphate acyltransferase [Rickettsiales bacterium]
MKTKKPTICGYAFATVRFALAVLWVFLNLPFILLSPGGRIGAWQFRFLMRGICFFAGFRTCVYGELAKSRPLLLVGNHISVVELGAVPAALGNNFFGKDTIAKMPIIGFIGRKVGSIFISRNPAMAAEMTRLIKEKTEHATWPMMIYPEGTSTNGAIVAPFKSAMFSIAEPQLSGDKNAAQFTIQPVVMMFRDKCGCKLSDADLAYNYAYFDPARFPVDGVKIVERSTIGQVFHIIALGGMVVELHLLPPPPLAGIADRKELAEYLHKIVEQKYMELK